MERPTPACPGTGAGSNAASVAFCLEMGTEVVAKDAGRIVG